MNHKIKTLGIVGMIFVVVTFFIGSVSALDNCDDIMDVLVGSASYPGEESNNYKNHPYNSKCFYFMVHM